ncbi:M17 family metallopeptidase [Stappia sp. ES.058]|uniref:leucyl aminopeptidase family protein n=1 Tax=Stappia sp. ES.058 TaxID=1881061 RepID=UPI00087CF8B3|nr:leucyl aminopeptidase family protein [Stappia sp. ES.058]SDT89006.1 leucyl aminopeptidase [Stappia sp. ES.058]
MRQSLRAFDPALNPVPLHLVDKAGCTEALGRLGSRAGEWAAANGFEAAVGQLLLVPGEGGSAAAALFGVADPEDPGFAAGDLARKLPAGDYALQLEGNARQETLLAFALSSYRFDRYRRPSTQRPPVIVLDKGDDAEALGILLDGVSLARDLINTPANDLGPAELAAAARELFAIHGGSTRVVEGEALVADGFPMIHAVGRASSRAPRLVDAVWGADDAPKVTLVGKGVVFDTGGLDIKPASGMALMKKDMGGAANVLGLASMIMAANLPVRLRVLIPAVENAISGSAFRPGDILDSRKGLRVEIGNTDAEGRLVLGDALTLADEEKPEILIDMATLTGAARVALGPELPPFFTDDEVFAGVLATKADETRDPLWRLPLWRPYESYLESRVADINHINTSGAGFAGSITAALFLSRFVEHAATWVHFDIYGWSPAERPARPAGGEAQGIRALFALLTERFA